tara:strand:+ start:632 stop:1030 length:399 start_codon:yes stop_codon:yes gene_type:complete
MIVITLNNIDFLNNSLQVGDVVYARNTSEALVGGDIQVGSFQAPLTFTGLQYLVGVLRLIEDNGDNSWNLHVDQSVVNNPYTPSVDDFIMFSKYSQGDAGVLGYYSNVKLTNNSKQKAEIFAVSSEVIINSK